MKRVLNAIVICEDELGRYYDVFDGEPPYTSSMSFGREFEITAEQNEKINKRERVVVFESWESMVKH